MRYMNPGYKDWLSVIGAGTSGYLNETTDTTKTKTGTAFYNRSENNYIFLDYPVNGEIYIKFDFYYARDSNNEIYFGEFANGVEPYNGLSCRLSGGNLRFLKHTKGQWAEILSGQNAEELGFKNNAINSALFHLKWTDSENGFIDFTVNDYSFARIESADFTLYNNSKIKLCIKTYYNPYISNIIISDEEVSIKEQIIALPITDIQTDMTYDSETGIYTASAVNQSLLASVNVADLINNFGSNSKVTGVAMIGNPAYRTAEGLSSFTSISKKNNTITEYGAVNIPTDTDSVVAHSFNVASDTTIADLQNMQLGLRVGG